MTRLTICAIAILSIAFLPTCAAVAFEAVDDDDILQIKSLKEAGTPLPPKLAAVWDSWQNPPAMPEVGAPGRDERGGPDDFGYRWRDVEEEGVDYEWIDITEGEMRGQQVQISDDSNHGPFDMDWTFNFYGREFRSFRAVSNGWISFTSQQAVYIPRAAFPSQDDPENIIAPFYTDLYPTGDSRNLWWYTNAQQQILIVSWIRVTPYDAGQRNQRFYTFQIILTGNGRMKFQYQTDERIDDNHIVQIGIQNQDRDDGLTVLREQGAGVPSDEYAIDLSNALGWVTGTVTDLATDDPIEGAQVQLSDGTTADTNEDGIFWLNEIPGEESYTATASAYGYNPVTSEEFEVADEETTAVDFALPHPEIEIDTEGYDIVLPQQGGEEHEFNIINDGNGPLEFRMRLSVPVRRDEPGDVIFDWDASEITGDGRLRGVTTDGVNYYLTGSNNNGNPNYVYVVSGAGELLRRFPQPVENPSANGMKGIITDGTYLYSADGRDIVQFDTQGEAVGVINSPLNPTTLLAYDAETDHFWVAATTTDIIEIDRDGEVIRAMDDNLRKYGIAWHPDDMDGYNLYVFQRVRDGSSAMLSKIDVETGDIIDVIDLATGENEAVDCALTNDFNPLVWMFVALETHGPVPEHLVGYELELNTNWVEVDPMEGIVDPESSIPISIIFDAGDWLPGEYELVLIITSNAAGDDLQVPLTLTVTDEGFEPQFYDEFIPTEFEHEFVIAQTVIRGEAAERGDEVGVFTPEGLLCGGSIWFGRSTRVVAYGDNPDTDFTEGFVDGEAPAFRVWDADIDRDFAAVFALSGGDERFTVGGSTRGSLEVPGQIRELVFDRGIGWSMISINVTLDEDDVTVMFAGLVERGSLEMLKDGIGRFYRPEFDFNNIPRWEELEGYQVKLARADRLSFVGASIDPATAIPLAAGWSMITYLPTFELDARDAFRQLGENLQIAKDGVGRFYVPAHDFSNMGNLSETNGYQVKVAEDVEFHYPQAGAAMQPMQPPPLVIPAKAGIQIAPLHLTAPSPTAGNMSLLVCMPGFGRGTEVAVLDESGRVCGVGILSAENHVGIAVWEDDPTTEAVEGPVAGETLTAAVWRDGLVAAEVKLIEGAGRYQTDGFEIWEIAAANASAPSELTLHGAYPNPFNAGTTIRFSIPSEAWTELTLYDLQGRAVSRILAERLSAGEHAQVWEAEGMSSGTYLLRLAARRESRLQKVVLVR